MRKDCDTCLHDDAEFSCYPHKTPCNECLHGNDAPTKWEAAEHYKPDTNADRIRAMSGEELAELLEEMTYDSMEHRAEYWLRWLKQPAE